MHLTRIAVFLLAIATIIRADMFRQSNPAPESSPASPVLGADMPLYPPLARTARIQGRVEVQVQIDSDGKVLSATAKSGHPVLVKAALDNAKTWRFAAKSTEQTLVYDFKIAEPAKDTDDPYYKYGRITFRPPNSVEIAFPPVIMIRD